MKPKKKGREIPAFFLWFHDRLDREENSAWKKRGHYKYPVVTQSD